MKTAAVVLAALALLDTGGRSRNLIGAKWDKFHASNIPDAWDVAIGDGITWRREAGADGGSAGVIQALRKDVNGKLLLEMEVRVDAHSLGGSGWWSDTHGLTGEYPAKVELLYLDAKEKQRVWAHGFLTADNPQKLRNYTKVPAGEWTKVRLEIDLGGAATLKRVRFYGEGWSFQGGVRKVRLAPK